jgi:uncharacterized protein
MKRELLNKLIIWKQNPDRKPLLLQGARQTGKTFILKEFGKTYYTNLHYFNFETEPQLHSLFETDLKPSRIIESLSLFRKTSIKTESDLIFFDEIQFSNNALNALKYFCEDAPQYHIVAAGSLLGVKLTQPRSFPVGKVTILTLHPMSFKEYLDACGDTAYVSYLEKLTSFEQIPIAFHEALIQRLKEYYFIGGMPEVVKNFIQNRNFEIARETQDSICKAYLNDFAKHAISSEIPKISIIWDTLPSFLARENKKFVFSAIAKTARAREYENAIRWLQDAGLINIAHALETIELPLSAFGNRNAFKLYMLDTGLLGCLSRLTPDILVHGNSLFTTFNGSFVENYIAQQLVTLGKPLFYWKREGNTAEVDFIIEHNNKVYPLEVKAGINPKSKSLQVYNEKYSPELMLRSTLLNARKDGLIGNIPLYAIDFLNNFI